MFTSDRETGWRKDRFDMLILYRIFLYLVLPVVWLRMLIRMIQNRQYLARLPQRFGFGLIQPKPEGIWIHSVSVGEVNASAALIEHMLDTYPERSITVTTMTVTGYNRIEQLFHERIHHCYLPYDYPGSVRRFLKSVQPALAMIIETEIWPNLITACHHSGVPMIYTNVRLSQRSFNGYQRFNAIIRPVLDKVNLFAAQSEVDAQRMISLGARNNRVQVTGNIKFDMPIPASMSKLAQSIRRQLGWERPIWIAGSTHEGEEAEIIETFVKVRKHIPQLLLVLVPRHPERFMAVYRLCTRRGFQVARRSDSISIDPETEIYIGDTMGELTLLIAASDVAFIGGSLVPTGGHNVLEASAAGIPVVFGPHMYNFSEIADLVLAKGAGIQVVGSEELSDVMIKLLNDPVLRHQYGAKGRELIEENKGAIQKIQLLVAQQLAR